MQGLREKLTYANVMSTLAVFLALGGGYAIATIKGDGRIVQGSEVIEIDPETVANIPGVVKVRASCTGALEFELKNLSGAAQQLEIGLGNDTEDEVLLPGEKATFIGSGNTLVQAFRPSGSGSPIASLTISGQYLGSCAAPHPVAVTAVSSE